MKIKYKYGQNIAETSKRYCHNKAVPDVCESVTPDNPSAHKENDMQEKNQALFILLFLSFL